MIIKVIELIVFLGLAMYSLVGLFSTLRILLRFNRYDELEKRTVVDAFAMSMVIILLVNLGQLILTFNVPVGWVGFISPGGFYNGGLVTNDPLHFDSFLFDCSIIGISYMLRRNYFGLLKTKNILIPIFILLAIIFIPFIISLIL